MEGPTECAVQCTVQCTVQCHGAVHHGLNRGVRCSTLQRTVQRTCSVKPPSRGAACAAIASNSAGSRRSTLAKPCAVLVSSCTRIVGTHRVQCVASPAHSASPARQPEEVRKLAKPLTMIASRPSSKSGSARSVADASGSSSSGSALSARRSAACWRTSLPSVFHEAP